MNIARRIVRKIYTLSLIAANFEAYRGGVNVYDLQNYSGSWIQDLGIKTVLDIGANTGQSARLFRFLFPDAMIYSFEPLPDCYRRLNESMKGDRRFLGCNYALGDYDGTVSFNRSEMTQASSVLPQAQSHKLAFPEADNVVSIAVKMRKLDGIGGALLIEENLLVKVDVQGFEDKVIDGGINTVRKAKIVIMEVSFVRLYDGQVLFSNMYNKMRTLGFSFGGVLDIMRDPKTARVLQADALFIK